MTVTKARPNPLRMDPTRTILQRRRLEQEIVRRMRRLQKAITKLIVEDDAFGLKDGPALNSFCPTGEGGGVDPTCSPGGKKSALAPIKGVKVVLDDSITLEGIQKILGPAFQLHMAGNLVGAQEGAEVLVEAGFDDDHVIVVIKHPKYEARRFIYKDEIDNESFYMKSGDTGHGIGSKVFKEQVDAAAEFGVLRISAFAAKGPTTNGYYTWARLGFDAELNKVVGFASHEEMTARFPQATKISDLMRSPEGREFWVKTGQGFPGIFDLTEGSLSRKVLSAYVKERAERASGRVSNSGPGGRGDSRQYLVQLAQNGDFASTQVNITDPSIIDHIWLLQQAVDQDDILKLEEQSHITIRYGLLPSVTAEQVEWIISQHWRIKVKLGSLSLFQNDKQDVLKVEVESKDLEDINRHLGIVPNTQTFRDYRPHLTVAYLKPGTGQKYVGTSGLEGTELIFESMVFSNVERRHTEITFNVFCPTGKGGGVDPTCGKGGSKEFGEWFKGSKVVDNNGEPLLVYHGTQAAVEGELDSRAWFTSDYEYAKQNAGAAGVVYSAYLSVKKPIPRGEFFDPEEIASEGFDGREVEDGVWVVKTSGQIRVVERKEITFNAFCPTGEGGGVDPTCSPKGKGYGFNDKGEAVLYHGTSSKFKSGILRDGLKAGEMFSERSEVFFTSDKKTAMRYASGAAKVDGGNPVVVEVGIPKHRQHLIEEDQAGRETGGDPGAFYVTGGVPSEELREVTTVTRGKHKTVEVLNTLTTNAGIWRWLSTGQKLQEFMDWVRLQMSTLVLGKLTKLGITDPDHWLTKYVEDTFRKGMSRAYDALKKPGLATKLDFYKGTKEEFLRSSFMRPVSIERVKLLASRSFNELQGVTDAMATQMQRILTDGFIRGENPLDIARNLSKSVSDIGIQRARTISRTECLVGDTLVDSAVVTAAFRRWYDGPVVEIETRNGRKLTTTPNHPMLTQDGWVFAGELNQSHGLIGRGGRKDSAFGNPNVDTRPSTIEEVFNSLDAIGISERVATSKPDFHGDGVDGEVDIARPDGELFIGDFSPITQPLMENILSESGRANSSFCCFCRRLLPLNKRPCFCVIADDHPLFLESSYNSLSIYPEILRNFRGGLPSFVSLHNQAEVEVGSKVVVDSSLLVRVGRRVRSTSSGYSLGFQDFPNLLGLGSYSFGNFTDTETGEVEIDYIRSLRVRPFSGHVYNLQTPFGYFNIAEGLFTGNTIRAHNEGQLEAMEGLGAEEVGVAVEWSTSGLGVTKRGYPSPCKVCAPLKGIVLSLKEAHGLLPRHPNCVVGETKVVPGSPLALIRGVYSGQILEISTAQGRRISVTENHVLLTQRGWVRAKEITNSDYLFHAPKFNGWGSPDDYLNISSIEEVYDASIELGSKRCESGAELLRSEDFHGDGKSFNGEISIVLTDRLLWSQVQTLLLGKVEKQYLVRGVIGDSCHLPSKSPLQEFLLATAAAADSFMGFDSSESVLFRGFSASDQSRSFSSSAEFDSLGFESMLYNEVMESHDFSYGRGSHTRLVQLNHLIQVFCRSRDVGTGRKNGSGSNGNPSLSEFFCEHVRIALEHLPHLNKRFVGVGVLLDNLIQDRVNFTGSRHVTDLPVYDVSTQESLYIANGILSSNCLCSFIPANVGEKNADQIRTRDRIQSAVDKSILAERTKKRSLSAAKKKSSWAGVAKKFSKKRPKSIV